MTDLAKLGQLEARLNEIDAELKSMAREVLPHIDALKEFSSRSVELQKERERLCFDRVLCMMGGS